MADQKRWFKLWCSAPADDDLLALESPLRWAWAALGCYTKEHGTRGRLKVSPSNTVLAAQMGVTPDVLKDTISRLPHMRVEEGKPDNGSFTVTWENWQKYQEDSTVYERVKRLRSKRRGEEKRREEKRSTPLSLTTETPPLGWNGLEEVRSFLSEHAVPAGLDDPGYWRRIDDWLGADNSGVAYLGELTKYLAWLESRPVSRRHRDLKAGFRNWLAKSEWFAEQKEMRRAAQAHTPRR